MNREKLEAYITETYVIEHLDMKRVKAAIDALTPAVEYEGYDERDMLLETLVELKDFIPEEIDDSAVLELALALNNLHLTPS